ncbi:MAG TPA: response regulator [Polyangia bacterium]|nr:response regulator [Polyangia bacterium]
MTGKRGAGSKGNILVVEDDETTHRLVARAAQAAGFSVLQARDGATGLALALTRPIDLILLDVNMPLLDGRDVLRHLKQDPRTANVPVLVCSGRSDQHSRRLAIELGALDFIEKPFNATLLMNKIARLITEGRQESKSPPRPHDLETAAEQALAIGRKLAGAHRAQLATTATPEPKRPLRLLLAEDTEDDALLLERQLRIGGFAVTIERVQTREAMRAALAQQSFDLVVSDYVMPGFDALDALATLKEAGLDLPFIVVSGTVDEASAVIALKAGAHDFVVKGNFARLVPAVERELREARARAERRQMEEQLMVSDRMASVGMLAAGVAHEINNALAGVLGNLSIVCELLENPQPSPHAAAEAAADAMTAADRVREIVRDIKIFSRGAEERLVPVDIHRVLNSTVRMAWSDIRHCARIVKQFGPIKAVTGSEPRLGQVFLNLIMNAAQAIEGGNALENEIRLSTWMDGSRVVIEVADTGAGIPPEILPRLFNAFVTTKAPGQGTGLGLSIARRIIDALGGEISVTSQPGHGATFRVTLPGTDQIPVAFDATTHADDLAGVPRSRILVVDDEVMVTNAIRRIIGQAHDIVVVFRAAEALQRIRSGERFDLILCDLLMPEMTGMALFQALTLAAPGQADRMLFMTGGTFSADAAAFLDAQKERVMEKPFDKASLMAAISVRLQAGYGAP